MGRWEAIKAFSNVSKFKTIYNLPQSIFLFLSLCIFLNFKELKTNINTWKFSPLFIFLELFPQMFPTVCIRKSNNIISESDGRNYSFVLSQTLLLLLSLTNTSHELLKNGFIICSCALTEIYCAIFLINKSMLCNVE